MWNSRQGGELAPFLSIFLYRMCPIFQISNVTGENLDLLKMFLNLLSPRTSYREEEPAEFQIDDTYSVPVRKDFPNTLPGIWKDFLLPLSG